MDSFDEGIDFAQAELLSRIEKLEQQVAELISTPKAGKKSIMKETWEPREKDYEWAKGFDVDVQRETDRFRDYWIAKGEHRANWYASWRNWVFCPWSMCSTRSSPRWMRMGTENWISENSKQ